MFFGCCNRPCDDYQKILCVEGPTGPTGATGPRGERGADGASVLFSGNSRGIPESAVDIALLAGTPSGAPYDPTTALSEYNSQANISDQR